MGMVVMLTPHSAPTRYCALGSSLRPKALGRSLRHKALRRGGITVLSAVLMVMFAALAAFAVDLGYLCLVRTELQRSADSGALAGAGALYDPFSFTELSEYVAPVNPIAARAEAEHFAQLNGAGRYRPGHSRSLLFVDTNPANEPQGDIVLGRLDTPSNLQEPLQLTGVTPNSVRVRLALTQNNANGRVNLFFAPVLGVTATDLSATATATVLDFPTLLPLATSLDHWETLALAESDQFGFENGRVTRNPDGIPELTVYPGSWNGVDTPPGNFGAVQIGEVSNAQVLREQINFGPSASDFNYYGGSLYEGMALSGQTGLSADIEVAFAGGRADGRDYPGIIGKVRFMPIYSDVGGTGTNASFTIAKFVSVRILHVQLKSGTKRLVVQPVDDLSELRAVMSLTR
jgi:hypothetical protein